MKRDSLFDKWFAFNYERLRAVFGRYLNEDAFHDAYLAMKKTCAFSDVAVERFEPYFFGVYKKCKSMCLRGESRYCHPDKEHFFLLRPEEETPRPRRWRPPTGLPTTSCCSCGINTRKGTTNFSG